MMCETLDGARAHWSGSLVFSSRSKRFGKRPPLRYRDGAAKKRVERALECGEVLARVAVLYRQQRKREKIGSYIGIAIGLVRLIPTILFLVPILVPMLILGQVIESIRKILGVEDKEPNGSA
jgi:hypothetical protein